MIEHAAHREAQFARDSALTRATFDSSGVYGVADRMDCGPAEALDLLVRSRVIPFISQRRRAQLASLVAMRDVSHVAAARQLGISRWTVATYRHQLGIDREPSASARHEAST